MLKLVTTIPLFFRSRQKLLIKRRKIRLRNRPMSKKQLQQERSTMNISYETKKVEIRKQMNRRKSQNHHLNAIIQDLFYPELQYNNLEEVDLRTKQISNDADLRQEQWEELLKMDDLQQDIRQNSLPMELLQLHQQKYEIFNYSHYLVLMQRLSYYCHNRERIQKQRMQNWNRTLQKMKVKDQKVKQQAKCPYLFLEREQIPRHEFWFNMVQKIKNKMENEKSIQNFNRYLQVLLNIQRTFYHIPSDLYVLAINRNSVTPIEQLKPEDKSDLLKLLKHRHKIRFNENIKIPTQEQEVSKQYNHVMFVRRLVSQVIENSQKYTIDDLSNIFKIVNSRKKRVSVISQHHFPLVEKIVETFINQLSFGDVQTFFLLYCSLNRNPNFEFIDILKFDLFRKADTNPHHYFILDLINRIKGRDFVFNVHQGKGVSTKQLRVKATQLLQKLTQVITKSIEKLKSNELILVLDCYYENQIKDLSLIQILSTEIVKKGSQYSLQVLGKSLFKLTLLGHRSKLLTKYIFKQFYERYHTQLKKYKEEGVFLLPTSEKVQSLPLDMKQIYLQECLLMTLWAVNKQLGSELKNTIDLEEVLHIVPIKMQSLDPLAIELATNLNIALKIYSFLPKIGFSSVQSQVFPVGRFTQFYGKTYSKDQLQSLMELQAAKTGIFIANYNKKDKMFLRQKWSTQFTYDPSDYIKFCTLNDTQVVNQKCFFDKQVTLDTQFFKKRRTVIQKYVQKEQKNSKVVINQKQDAQKNKKLYQLLL